MKNERSRRTAPFFFSSLSNKNQNKTMKPSLPLAALAALLLLLLSSPSIASAEISEEATICAAGSKQAAAESSSSESSSSCGAFFEPGPPLTAAEVAAIAAGAPPAQARSEADSSPFNATVPCPTTDIIGSGIDPARVEAQVRKREREIAKGIDGGRERNRKKKKPFRHLLSLSAPPHSFSLDSFGCNSRELSELVTLASLPAIVESASR